MANQKSNLQETIPNSTDKKVEIFRQLALHDSECVYLDFKKELHLKRRGEKKRFIQDVLSLYNALSESLYDGIVGIRKKSAYLLIGISYKDGKKMFWPLMESDLLNLDDSVLNEIVYHSITPTSFVKLHKITYEGDKDIPAGMYGLVEIIRGDEGPAVLRDAPNEIYSRYGSTNIHHSKLKESDKNIIYSYFDVRFEAFVLNDLYEDLHAEQLRNVFKIMLINDSGSYSEKDRETFSHKVSAVKWNIIIDMDHFSRQSGFGDKIGKGFLKRGNSFIPRTYDALDIITECHINDFADDIRTLYIMADGCADTHTKGPDKPQKVKVPVCKTAEKIFKKVKCPRPVLCFVVVSGYKKLSWYDKIVCALEDAYIASESAIGGGAFFIKYMVTQKEYQDSLVVENEEEILVCPLHQIGTFFCNLFKDENTELYDDVSIPGKSGPVTVSFQDYNRIRNYIELYSTELEEDMKEVTPEEINKVRIEYLKGGCPTTKIMTMQEKSLMLVVRERYKEYFKVIKERIQRLKKRPFTVNHKDVFITHDPSAGGTTLGKWVLWQLHKDYPCLEIIKFNSEEEIIAELEELYKMSFLPLVILLDSNNFPNVVEVERSLCMALINCTVAVFFIAIVRLDSSTKLELSTAVPKSAIVGHLTQELEGGDRSFFCDLYKQIKHSSGLDRADRVYLFGLFSFLQQYDKMSEIIENCLKDSTTEQTSIIHTACMITWYTGQSLPFHLAAKLLKSSPTSDIMKISCNLQTCPETLLGESRFLLVADHTGFRCPHRCMTIQLLDKCVPPEEGQEDNDTGDQVAKIHYRTFFQPLSKTFAPLGADPMYELLVRLLLFKTRTLQDEKKHYSLFIEEMLKKLGGADTINLLNTAVNSLHYLPSIKAHTRAVVAKLYMYQVSDFDKSLKEIETAISEIPNDAILHNNHGYLLKNDLKTEIKYSDSGEHYLRKVLGKFSKTLLAFQSAKNYDRDESQLPWYSIGELRTHLLLLEYIMKTVFQKDISNLHSAIESPRNYIEEKAKLSFVCSLEVLDKLDLHLERKPNTDAEKETFKSWLKLFQLWGDKPTHTKVRRFIPFGIGQCIRSKGTYGDMLRHWCELGEWELETIVDTLYDHLPDKINEMSFHRHSLNDLLTALVWLRCRSSSKRVRHKCNINTASHFCDIYVKAFPFDHNAFFFRGMLLVLQGLQLTDEGKMTENHGQEKTGELLIEKAMESLHKCTEKVRKYSKFHKLQKVQYIIGSNTDLGALVPRSSAESEQQSELSNFRVFHGRLVTNEDITVRDYVGLEVKYKWKKGNLHKFRKSQPLLKFNIAFSFKNGAVSWNECMVDDNRSIDSVTS